MSAKPVDIAELRRLMAAATPGPWSWDEEMGEVHAPHRCNAECPKFIDAEDVAWHTRPRVVLETDGGMYLKQPDARAIVAAVNALPALLSELDELRARLAAAERVVHALESALVDTGPHCIVCAEDIETDDDPCDTPCSGHDLRKAFVAYRDVAEGEAEPR